MLCIFALTSEVTTSCYMKSNVIQAGENQIRIDKIEKCQVGGVQLQHKKLCLFLQLEPKKICFHF